MEGQAGADLVGAPLRLNLLPQSSGRVAAARRRDQEPGREPGGDRQRRAQLLARLPRRARGAAVAAGLHRRETRLVQGGRLAPRHAGVAAVEDLRQGLHRQLQAPAETRHGRRLPARRRRDHPARRLDAVALRLRLRRRSRAARDAAGRGEEGRRMRFAVALLLGVATAHAQSGQAEFDAATALEAKGEYAQAADALEKLARERPDDPFADDALFEAATIAEERLGDPERAARLYDAVAKKYPS